MHKATLKVSTISYWLYAIAHSLSPRNKYCPISAHKMPHLEGTQCFGPPLGTKRQNQHNEGAERPAEGGCCPLSTQTHVYGAKHTHSASDTSLPRTAKQNRTLQWAMTDRRARQSEHRVHIPSRILPEQSRDPASGQRRGGKGPHAGKGGPLRPPGSFHGSPPLRVHTDAAFPDQLVQRQVRHVVARPRDKWLRPKPGRESQLLPVSPRPLPPQPPTSPSPWKWIFS